MDALKSSYASDSNDSDNSPDESEVEARHATNKTVTEFHARDGEHIANSGQASNLAENSDTVRETADLQQEQMTEINKICVNEANMKRKKISVIDADSIEDNPDKTSSKVDFFGLSADDSDELDEGEFGGELPCDNQETLTLDGKQVNVEIPNTDFWSGLDISQLQTYQTWEDQNTETLKRKMNYEHGAPNKKVNLGRKHRSGQPSVSNENYFNKVTQCQQLPEDSTQTQKRKLFYVHNKVKPYLHAHARNTTPSKLEWTQPAHAGAINRIKWNVPEFSHLFVTCSMDSTVKIWNIWTQLDPCLSVLKVHDKAVRDVDWNQSGKQLLSCSFDKTAKITDVETGVAVHSLAHRSFVTCGKYHPGQPYICVTGEKDKIQTWDLRAPSAACKTFGFKDSMGQIQDLVFSQHHDTLFSCSDLISRDSSDRNMMAWDVKTGAPLSNQIYQERYTLTRLKVHPSDRTLLAQSYGNYIALFSLERPYKMYKNKRFDGHKLLGYSLGFDISTDGSSVYSGSSDGTIHCYNYQSGKQLRTIRTTMDVVMDLASHPVLHSTVAVCGWDGTVQVWK